MHFSIIAAFVNKASYLLRAFSQYLAYSFGSDVICNIASASAFDSQGSTLIPEQPSSLTQETPDPGMRVATTGFLQLIASICTIPKASVFQMLLKQNTLQVANISGNFS